MYGIDIVGDACNGPYALVIVALLIRGGLSTDMSPLCTECKQVDLYKISTSSGRIPNVNVALFNFFQKQVSPKMLGESQHRAERLGDVVECCGAMCDITQTEPRMLQEEIRKDFTEKTMDDEYFNKFQHTLIHLCSYVRRIWKALPSEDTETSIQEALEIFRVHLTREQHQDAPADPTNCLMCAHRLLPKKDPAPESNPTTVSYKKRKAESHSEGDEKREWKTNGNESMIDYWKWYATVSYTHLTLPTKRIV